MFRSFSTGLFLLHGAMFAMVSSFTLLDFRDAVTNASVDLAELETITSKSNAGSYCVTARMEPAFMLAFALQLICVGLYTPTESRSIPAMAASAGMFNLAHSCYMVKTNTLGVQIFEGEFWKLFEPLFYMNTMFGSLYFLVAVGTILGFAKVKKE